MKTLYYVHDEQSDPTPRLELLQSCGYDVVALKSGDALMRRLYDERPALVILDVLLTGVNGFDVCRDLRSRFSAEQLPIMILGGIFRSDRFAAEARQLGAQDFVVEPIGLPELVNRIIVLLGEEPLELAQKPSPSVKAEDSEVASISMNESSGAY